MPSPHLLALASFFAPDAFADEPLTVHEDTVHAGTVAAPVAAFVPLPDGSIDLDVRLIDGSEAAFHLTGVPACTWQQLRVRDEDGGSWRLDVRAEGRERGVLVEAELQREAPTLEVRARPTLLVLPGVPATVSMQDDGVELYQLTVRAGMFGDEGC